MNTPVSIEITRDGGALTAVNIIMPTWTRIGSDGKLYAKAPLMGGFEIYGTDEYDLEVAIKEAITCLFIGSEKHGKGLESELEAIGWERADATREGHAVFNVNTKNELFNSVLSTGDVRAFKIEMPNPEEK